VAPELNVAIVNRQRGRKVSGRALLSFIDRLSAKVPPDCAGELSVCLVSERRMRELNRVYRGRDASTDVLAFPSQDGPMPDGRRHHGDIVICVPAAARQASERGHSFSRELKILLLHGYLHLLGFDHESDDGTMLRLQRRLVRVLLAPPPRSSSVERAG
jgi:probable rRNA maturation factor